jgi:hypothetical protein
MTRAPARRTTVPTGAALTPRTAGASHDREGAQSEPSGARFLSTLGVATGRGGALLSLHAYPPNSCDRPSDWTPRQDEILRLAASHKAAMEALLAKLAGLERPLFAGDLSITWLHLPLPWWGRGRSGGREERHPAAAGRNHQSHRSKLVAKIGQVEGQREASPALFKQTPRRQPISPLRLAQPGAAGR